MARTTHHESSPVVHTSTFRLGHADRLAPFGLDAWAQGTRLDVRSC